MKFEVRALFDKPTTQGIKWDAAFSAEPDKASPRTGKVASTWCRINQCTLCNLSARLANLLYPALLGSVVSF
jgi:hypothetical protein